MKCVVRLLESDKNQSEFSSTRPKRAKNFEMKGFFGNGVYFQEFLILKAGAISCRSVLEIPILPAMFSQLLTTLLTL